MYINYNSLYLFYCLLHIKLSSVSSFSGTLLTYLVMKELKKKGGKLNWGMFYFHRFWR